MKIKYRFLNYKSQYICVLLCKHFSCGLWSDFESHCTKLIHLNLSKTLVYSAGNCRLLRVPRSAVGPSIYPQKHGCCVPSTLIDRALSFHPNSNCLTCGHKNIGWHNQVHTQAFQQACEVLSNMTVCIRGASSFCIKDDKFQTCTLSHCYFSITIIGCHEIRDSTIHLVTIDH